MLPISNDTLLRVVRRRTVMPKCEGYLRCEETNATIMALVRDGVPLKEIVADGAQP